LSSESLQIRKPRIFKFLPETGEVEFDEGNCSPSRASFDKFIFCTGYKYDFGFIKIGKAKDFDKTLKDAKSRTKNQKDKVFEDFQAKNIYEHMFYISQRKVSSLAWVGLTKMTSWAVPKAQAAFIAKVFAGQADLLPKPTYKSGKRKSPRNGKSNARLVRH
jgi:hypothetical protein